MIVFSFLLQSSLLRETFPLPGRVVSIGSDIPCIGALGRKFTSFVASNFLSYDFQDGFLRRNRKFRIMKPVVSTYETDGFP